ncbi:MAG TPA: preprotein translocase subunit SecG [Pyrinomonadaceae bacterium]|jgi:preprotein translocase subunit SecG|nr:preprotein translocase subunit SecG [Pyrinomonadaceae bacterium]
MVYFLYALFFISCIVLVGSVLLQPGKTDAGALFTSNVSSSAFAPRGTATVLSKITIIAAATFMLSALFLAMPAFTGNVSVLSANPDATTDASSASANSNTADANANTAAPADANANTAAPVADANANAAPPAASNANAPAANAAANKPAANKPAANAPAKAPAKK